MNKEEITSAETEITLSTEELHKITTEYAKQQGLAFDRWKRINLYTFDIDTGEYIKLITDGDNARTEQHSFDQVYAKFISESTVIGKGSYVRYSPKNGPDKKGRVKGISGDIAFVVYLCDDNWDNFEMYTGSATSIVDLKLGWE